MAKSIVLGNHTSSLRDSWWYLEQRDDGSLWVRYENDDDHSDDWEKPLADVLVEGGSTAEVVQKRIDLMFDKDA